MRRTYGDGRTTTATTTTTTSTQATLTFELLPDWRHEGKSGEEEEEEHFEV